MASTTREQSLKNVRVRLTRLASSQGVRFEDVEDVVQEVFIVMEQEEYKSIQTETDLLPLGCRILFFKIKEQRRKNARLDQLPEDGSSELPDDASSPLDNMVDNSLRQQMLRGIEALKPGCKELLGLQLAGYSYDDIGEKLKIGKGNAYTKVHRCINSLREKMGVKNAGK